MGNKDYRIEFEVVMVNKKTSEWKTFTIKAISMKIAQQKVDKEYGELYDVYDIHLYYPNKK